MNARQEARLSMYDAVINHCNTNAAIVSTVPAFQSAVTAFQNNFADIKKAVQSEIKIIAGITVNKGEQRKALMDLAANMAAQIFAYAAVTGKHILKAQVSLNPSDFIRLKDEMLAPTCQNILTAANENRDDLVAYGVTAAKITSFANAITAYANAVPAPRNAVAGRTSVAGTIKELFKSGDEILKQQIDKLAQQFKSTEPGFYAAYKSNRIILDPGTSSTQLQGTITSIGTEIPLVGATVKAIAENKEYTTIANNIGEYTLKIPLPGFYTITFTKAGHQEKKEENVEIKLGQTTTLNIELQNMPS